MYFNVVYVLENVMQRPLWSLYVVDWLEISPLTNGFVLDWSQPPTIFFSIKISVLKDGIC